MKFSQVEILERESLSELLSAWPGLGRLLVLFLRLGIFGSHLKSVDRDPVGWWEWLWTLLGWQYKEVKEFVHLDLLYLLIWVVTVVGVGLALWWTTVNVVLGIRWLMKQFLVLVVLTTGKIYGFFFRVFRVLASDLDPGSSVKVLVPGKKLISYTTESMRAGSAMVKLEVLDCQVALGVQNGDRFLAYGCGIRLDIVGVDDPFIITPMHVYSSLPDRFHVRGKTGSVEIDKTSISSGGGVLSRTMHVIDTDLVGFQITSNEAALVGAKKAVIQGSIPDRGTVARITGPMGEGSTGVLKADPVVFGQLIYSGSTVAGFSGAGYVVTRQVAGIHCAGGTRNVGYSLRLAYVTLAHLCKIKSEDTDDWLRDVITKKRSKVVVDLAWQHLDSQRIFVRGQYHIVDRDSWNSSTAGLDLSPDGTLVYDDSESTREERFDESLISKNSSRPTFTGSASSTESPQEELSRLRLKIKNQSKHLQVCQAKLELLGKERESASAGQEGIPTPSSQS